MKNKYNKVTKFFHNIEYIKAKNIIKTGSLRLYVLSLNKVLGYPVSQAILQVHKMENCAYQSRPWQGWMQELTKFKGT